MLRWSFSFENCVDVCIVEVDISHLNIIFTFQKKNQNETKGEKSKCKLTKLKYFQIFKLFFQTFSINYFYYYNTCIT